MALIRHGGVGAGSVTLMLATATVLLLELLMLSSPAQALQNGAANVPPMGE